MTVQALHRVEMTAIREDARILVQIDAYVGLKQYEVYRPGFHVVCSADLTKKMHRDTRLRILKDIDDHRPSFLHSAMSRESNHMELRRAWCNCYEHSQTSTCLQRKARKARSMPSGKMSGCT